MNNQDCMNGLEHSLLEIDQGLAEQIPHMNRKMHREVITQAIDELLDRRILVTEMMAELVIQGEII